MRIYEKQDCREKVYFSAMSERMCNMEEAYGR